MQMFEHDFKHPLELDLANPMHADYVEECFGGRDYFGEKYPELYLLFQNGINRAKTQSRHNSEREDRKGFRDVAYVVDVIYHREKKCIYAVGDMNLVKTARRLYLSLEIYKGEKLVGHNVEFYSDVNYGSLECYSQPFDIPLGEVQQYKAVLTVTWEPEDEDYLRAMLAAETSDISYGSNVDAVASMTVKDPVHRVSSESGPIKVVYARGTNDMDYVYPETRDPVTKEEKVLLDMSGEVHLNEGHIFGRLVSFNAMLQCDGYGTIVYVRDPSQEEIQPIEDGRGFIWNLDKDWDSSIPDSVKFGQRTHCFDMQLKFYCEQDHMVHKIIVSSKEYPELKGLSNYQQISEIQLFWGCVAEDTQILMADGSVKRADRIAVGDKIRDKDGNIDTITKIISGTSQTMYHLKLESGKELLATDDHPVYTRQGLDAIINLNTNSDLLIAGGKGEYEDVIYCYPIEYRGKIYSFELEKGDTLCTNGIVTGSYTEQGKVGDKLCALRECRNAVDAVVLAEIQQLREDDLEGRIFRLDGVRI